MKGYINKAAEAPCTAKGNIYLVAREQALQCVGTDGRNQRLSGYG